MNAHDFEATRLRRQRVTELAGELSRPELTPAMLSTVMNATVEACADAYLNQDFANGDRFAQLNSIAHRRAFGAPEVA